MPASSPFTPSHRPTASSSQWLFAKSEVLSSPSVQAGWAPDQENVTRAKGIQLISEVGQKLRLQQTTIATAAMFFHRFYIRMSFIAYHHYAIAATCIFLATKVQENPRKLPDIIINSSRFSQKNWNFEIDEQSKEYWRWRDTILFNEEVLMEQLCFDFDVVHPYDYLVSLVKRFTPGNSALGKCAWAFINDRTPMQLIYPAHVIAASSFYFARKHTQTIVPKSPEGKEWYEQYHVKLEDMKDAVMMMVETYKTLPHLKYHGTYPSHVISPSDTEKSTPQPNGAEIEMREPSASPVPPVNDKDPSPMVTSPLRKNGDIATPTPRRQDPSISPDCKRGRSPERRSSRSGLIDSYRPRRENSRSHSRGRGPPLRNLNRYSPGRNRRRDSYVPPPRKRSVDEDAEHSGREKRKRDDERDDGEVSEGEIR